MKRPINGSTPRQIRFAQELLGQTKKSKRQIALSVGYSDSMADKSITRIENAEGTQIALGKLYAKAGNLTMKVFSELQSRDLSTFENKEILSAVKIMVDAFDKLQKKDETVIKVQNNLKQVFMNTHEVKHKEKTIDAKATPASDTHAQVIDSEQDQNAGDTSDKV